MDNRVAKADVTIKAPVEKVWEALVTPAIIKSYMFGTDVQSEWKAGSPIVWQGEYQGKKYEDHGRILEVVPQHKLRYSHFSPLSGLPDTPENYHQVTIDLAGEDGSVKVALAQDQNHSAQAQAESEKNWNVMLAGLKKTVEAAS
ncbi:MAG TPA: SRPBCC family protein [Polyangia bacterium]|jgi:uncharacterized protein YndB with AHSA1/START domain|nr:SRPBCC family protein [Polyangia bacterium]